MSELISVIVPVYNIAADLPRCLNSILAQTYPSIEVIAVDDGSTDSSGIVLDNYGCADSRIHVIHKKKGGVTSARLQGIASASGSWIGFVDGDDEIEPDMYERLMKNAHDAGADISHCGHRMVFPDGRVRFYYNTGKILEQAHFQGMTDLLQGDVIEPGLCTKLYRKELFAGIDTKMDASIRNNEDLLMNYYLFSEARRSVFEDFCPYHYIVRQTSASRARMNGNKMFDPVRVKEIIFGQAPEEIREVAGQVLARTCVYSYCSILSEEEDAAREGRRVLRQKLIAYGQWLGLLPLRTRLLAGMIIRTPGLVSLVYPIYEKHLQKKKYD